MTTTSRPDLGWGDLDGLQVGIWGIGVEGRANVARAEAAGAEVVLVDDHPPADGHAGDGRPVFATEAGGLDELAGCDVVVKSPGISRYRPEVVSLQIAGVPIAGGLGLWLHDAPLERVVAITGTKGKSTTASVLGHLLTGVGRRTVVGGNLGTPPWHPDAPAIGEVDTWVIEVSSYQATDLPVSPPVVAVTSLGADHLDWHGGYERYVADKLSLCTQPGAELTVAADAPELRRHAAALGPRVEWVSASDAAHGGGPHPDARWTRPLGLLGAHNRANAQLARACLAALGEAAADDPDRLAALAAGFTPLPSRLTLVATVDGVDFVDDSLSTNVLPTVAAVGAFADRRVALLVGGFDRGIDYAPLAEPLRERTEATLVLTLPDSGDRIRTELLAAGVGDGVEVRAAADLAAATAAGFAWARPGGVVLLSPAAPSFGRFRDYRDRGEAFAAAARACAP
jgi:UDP-N-acetylmuramoylalanine--D-glutamate ligase